MAVGLSGNLVDFGIADVFQLIGQQRKTGVLELHGDTGRARLCFEDGLVVSAAMGWERAGELDALADRLVRCGVLTLERAQEAQAACRSSAQTLDGILEERGWCSRADLEQIEELVTRDAIFEVLRWRGGSFDFRAETIRHQRDRSLLLGAEQILMDGLRMVDEWQSFSAHVPSEDTIFQRAGDFERYAELSGRRSEEETAQARRVFELCDGRIPVRRAIDLARLGTFDGVRCVAELCQAGALRALRPESVRRLHRLQVGSKGAGWTGRVAAGGLSLLVLLAAVGWTAVTSQRAQPAVGHAVEVSTLVSLRQSYRIRAVRNAIDAHQFQAGEWPEPLSSLEEKSLLPPGALAASQVQPYYSLHRGRGPILLAPERSPRGTR